MGALHDETFSDALEFALAAGMLSCTAPHIFSGQMPIVFLASSTPCDLMNPTTPKPFTILNSYMSILGSTKILRPSYVAIPLYPITSLPTLQVQVPPPQSIPSPHPWDSVFWDVVQRTVDYSVHGTVALVSLFSAISEAASQEDLALPQDDQRLSSCDSFDLDFLPSISAEDDLLHVDISELESIPSSELYLGEEDLMTVVESAAPRLFSNKSQRPPPPQSSSSDTTLAILIEDYLPDEDLSVLLRMSDKELYFNLELGGQGAALPYHSTHFLSLSLRYR